MYSTVYSVGPWLLSVTCTSVPGTSKFWKPIFGPLSCGAEGANAVPDDADAGAALPEYWKPANALKYTTWTENVPVPTSGLLGSRSTISGGVPPWADVPPGTIGPVLSPLWTYTS